MNKIFISHLYSAGSAATNRIIAYAKGFSELGMDVYLILSAETPFSIPRIENIKIFKCLGNHLLVNAKVAELIKNKYTPLNSIILVYGTPTLCWFLPGSKYNIFYECTEIPFYGRKKTLKNKVKECIKIFLARRATGMLVISNALAGYFRGKGICNIIVINMFVDTERFSCYDVSEKKKYIAYCGKISPLKDGVDYLIKAFALFHKSHPEYELKLIGKFESLDADHILRSLVDELCLSEVVSFTGMIEPERMPQLLCGAQMLALARPNNEQSRYGFPTKLGEYLATGKPVVVTNVGEIGVFLNDGENCCMSRPDDVEDFANKMLWVADNYDKALKIGERGKELTLKEFSNIEQCKRVIAFIEKTLA